MFLSDQGQSVADQLKKKTNNINYALALEKTKSNTHAQILERMSQLESMPSTSAPGATLSSKAVQKELMKNVEVPAIPYQLFEILVQKCKKEGLLLDPAFVHHYLRAAPNANLALAFTAIKENIQKRVNALLDSGRVSVEHESTILKIWDVKAAKFLDSILNYLENEEKQLKELPTLGWKSSLGLHIKSLAAKGHYKDKEYCMAGLFEYHTQLNDSRIRRAMFFYQLKQQKLSEKELDNLLTGWDLNQNNLLHVVPINETPAQHDARLTRLNRARGRISIPISPEEEQQIQAVLWKYQKPCADANTYEDPFLGLVSDVIKECEHEKAENDAKVSPNFS